VVQNKSLSDRIRICTKLVKSSLIQIRIQQTHGIEELTSVGSIPGLDSQRLDSFSDFCERARRLDSKVKESIHFKIRAVFLARILDVCEPHM
jgi:hypothetical protein